MVRVRRRSRNFWRREIERGIREYEEEKREQVWQRRRRRLIDRLAGRRLAARLIIARLALPRTPAAPPPVRRWRPEQPVWPY